MAVLALKSRKCRSKETFTPAASDAAPPSTAASYATPPTHGTFNITSLHGAATLSLGAVCEFVKFLCFDVSFPLSLLLSILSRK